MHPCDHNPSKERWITQVDPRTKVAWLALLIIWAGTNTHPLALTLGMLLVIIASVGTGTKLSKFTYPLLALALVFLQILLANLIFNHQDSLLLTLIATLRLGTIILALLQFTQWTPADDIVLMLVQFKIPYRLAMLVGLAIRFLPLMQKELITIMSSQSTRGLAMESTVQRLKNFIPITLPFLYRSLRRANETALAMELRGFGYARHRTFSKELKLSKLQRLLMLVMFCLACWQIAVLLPRPLFN